MQQPSFYIALWAVSVPLPETEAAYTEKFNAYAAPCTDLQLHTVTIIQQVSDSLGMHTVFILFCKTF